MICMSVEAWTLRRSNTAYGDSTVMFFMPFASAFLFLLILNIQLRDRKIFFRLRDDSTLIYLVHCIVIRCTIVAKAVFNFQTHSMIHFLFVLVISIAIAEIVRYLVNSKKAEWLKIIY